MLGSRIGLAGFAALWAGGEVFGWLCQVEERAPSAGLQYSSSGSRKGKTRCCLVGN